MYKYDLSGLLRTYSEQFARASDDATLKVILKKLKEEMKQIKVVTVDPDEE